MQNARHARCVMRELAYHETQRGTNRERFFFERPSFEEVAAEA